MRTPLLSSNSWGVSLLKHFIMELITGKALFDFNKWLYKNQNLEAYNLFGNEIVSSALIISFFDSVGIGIDSYSSLLGGKLNFSADIIAEFDIQEDCATINLGLGCENRIEATKIAIQKANEIYNERF